jgi:hypothetical protein
VLTPVLILEIGSQNGSSKYIEEAVRYIKGIKPVEVLHVFKSLENLLNMNILTDWDNK